MGRGGESSLCGQRGVVKSSGTLGKCVVKKTSGCGVGACYFVQHWCMVPVLQVWPNFFPPRPAKENRPSRPVPYLPNQKIHFFLAALRTGFTSLRCNLRNTAGRGPACEQFSFPVLCGYNNIALVFGPKCWFYNAGVLKPKTKNVNCI